MSYLHPPGGNQRSTPRAGQGGGFKGGEVCSGSPTLAFFLFSDWGEFCFSKGFVDLFEISWLYKSQRSQRFVLESKKAEMEVLLVVVCKLFFEHKALVFRLTFFRDRL